MAHRKQYTELFSIPVSKWSLYRSPTVCINVIVPLDEELLLWLSKHLNQCVLLSMELHWTLVLHSALTSDLPMDQLKLARYDHYNSARDYHMELGENLVGLNGFRGS